METINLETITREVNHILEYSQNYPFRISCDNLIAQWMEAKKNIIEKLLGTGQTRIKYPRKIQLQLTLSQKRQKFSEFLQILKDNNILESELETFLQENEETFFENRVKKSYPERGINSGSKLSKTFKKFIIDPENLRWVQDVASKYMQENKIEGYLYLSVDPRDFLSLSDNNENWRSCQTLDGDYRSGNLNYMVDKTTIIAYLTDEKDKQLKIFPEGLLWNSKKWRMLIHLEPGKAIYFNKQYPYSSKTLLELVHEFITSRMSEEYSYPCKHGFHVINGVAESQNYLHIGTRVYCTIDLINVEDYNGYCDLITSPTYENIISYPVQKVEKAFKAGISKEEEDSIMEEVFTIKIGESPICPHCGKGYVHSPSSFLCNKCILDNDITEDFFDACAWCGRRVYLDDEEIFWDGDEPICKECNSIRNKQMRGKVIYFE